MDPAVRAGPAVLRLRGVAKYLRALMVCGRPANQVLVVLRSAERLRPPLWVSSVIHQHFRLPREFRPAATGCLAEVAVFLVGAVVRLVAVYPAEVVAFPEGAVVRPVVAALRRA
ncbi:hypothetical protein ASE69_20350 [Sphingomonas sp. Leaf208]|nr:hypothetical protein ASE69_20350 [Sphingomonas sp. Leaf208]